VLDNLKILKLGGSVITKKDEQTPALNYENLKRIAREIAESNHSELLIVHGAGSYGHPYAREYKIGEKIENSKNLNRKMLGFSKIHQSVNELNSLLCNELEKLDLPNIPLPPSAFITTRNKRILTADTTLINKYLKKGFIPVLYGDVVLDENESIQMAVLSGDQIITYLAGKLRPERVILATDVDGIYNKNPKKYPDAKLLETISSAEQIETEKGKTVDVTGGMGGKIKELMRLLDLGIESEIINANQKGLLKKALKGEKVRGTTIKRN
jgi:isopentenyl phosphate kinase